MAQVTIMIPLDTIKTRIVTQAANPNKALLIPYKGVADCFMRILREEGFSTFYKPLPPRLASVVPMIGIQFGVYEAMKRYVPFQPRHLARPDRFISCRLQSGCDLVYLAPLRCRDSIRLTLRSFHRSCRVQADWQDPGAWWARPMPSRDRGLGRHGVGGRRGRDAGERD